MTISELTTLKTAALAALASADYDTAIEKALAAQMLLAVTPNISRNLAGGGSQSITWNPSQIDQFVAHCRKLKSASTAAASTTGPFQQTKVKYVRPDITA